MSFVPIRFVIGELLSEARGWVGHGLVLAWFESCVLRLAFLESSLQSPGQEKHFGILFTPFRDEAGLQRFEFDMLAKHVDL